MDKQEVKIEKPKQKLSVEPWKNKVSELVETVENPKDREAKATFGYRATEAEKQRSAALKTLFDVGIWLVALVLIALILALNWQTLRDFFDLMGQKPANSPELTPVTTVSETATTGLIDSIFAGTVHQIVDQGWLRAQFFDEMTYYQAGEVVSGEYQGAWRYLVVAVETGTRQLKVYELWRLANGQVYLNGGRPRLDAWIANLEDYYLHQYFADGVNWLDTLPSDWPQTLPLDATTLMYRRGFLTDFGPYDATTVGEAALGIALSPEYYQSLSLLESRAYHDLKFYTKMYDSDDLYTQVAPNLNPSDDNLVDKYLFGGTKVVVMDKTGVSVIYEMVSKDAWEKYQKNSLNRDLLSVEYYGQDLARYTQTSAFAAYKAGILSGATMTLPVGTPTRPEVELGLPGWQLATGEFEFNAENTPLYQAWNSALTSACQGILDAKVVQNVALEDLESVGQVYVSQKPIYRLKDQNHDLYKLAYDLKFTDSEFSQDELIENNFVYYIVLNEYSRQDLNRILSGRMPIAVPTQVAYAGRSPLLFVTDPWDRIVMLWESDLDFLRDCVIIEENGLSVDDLDQIVKK